MRNKDRMIRNETISKTHLIYSYIDDIGYGERCRKSSMLCYRHETLKNERS